MAKSKEEIKAEKKKKAEQLALEKAKLEEDRIKAEVLTRDK